MDDATRRVAHRLGTRMEPAIGSVRAAESPGQVEGTSLVGTTPRMGSRLEIILMDHGVLHLEFHEVVQGSPEVLRASADAVQASPGIVGETGIDVVRLAVRCGTPHHRRQRFDQPVQTLLALAQRLVRALLVVDVDVHAVPADLLAHGIEDAYSGNTKPTVSTVESPNPVLEDVPGAGRDGVGCCC